MKKAIELIIIFIFIIAFNACFSYTPVSYTPPIYYEPSEVRGMGVIIVTSEYTYTEYQTVTRERYIPGSGYYAAGQPGYGSTSKTETYTERVPVIREGDNYLSFIVYKNCFEIFRGVTPIR